MEDTVGALVGSLLIGTGTLLTYAAIKNKRVFGVGGMLPKALTTGSLADLDTVPAAYGSFKAGESGVGVLVPDVNKGAQITIDATATLKKAVAGIGARNSSLATRIAAEVASLDSTSTRDDVMPLAQLLALAEQQGMRSETNAIRTYVKVLTGESI